jgi:hypothetical protein
MTTIHRRLDSTTHSGYTLKGILRNAFQWGGAIAIVVAFIGFIFIAGVNYQKANTPEVSFLQNELRIAYGDNNRWQSQYAELAGQVDVIDDSSFRTGWYTACVEFRGGSEQECFEWAGEVER